MAPHAIVSYDDTENDHDALMLARVLRDAGAELTLAYVSHARQPRAANEADALLARGAAWLDDRHAERRVVISGSTGEGLGWLAAHAAGDVIVFGSEYRTRVGHLAIGHSAQTLLENGPAALALAPAGYAAAPVREIGVIGILPGTADEAAIETAYSLAGRLGATVTDSVRGVDLVVAGSRPEARDGHVMITASAHNAMEELTAPVLIVARGVPLSFETLVTA